MKRLIYEHGSLRSVGESALSKNQSLYISLDKDSIDSANSASLVLS